MTALNINDIDDVVLALCLGFVGLAFIIYPIYSRFLKKGMAELDPKTVTSQELGLYMAGSKREEVVG